MLLNVCLMVGGLVAAAAGFAGVVFVFDSRKQNRKKLARLAVRCYRRGLDDADPAVTPDDDDIRRAALEQIQGESVVDRAVGGTIGEIFSLLVLVAGLAVGVYGFAGLVYQRELDDLTGKLNADPRVKAKDVTPFNKMDEYKGWTPERFIKIEKDGLRVLETAEGFTLYINDRKSGMWKALPNAEFYSLERLAFSKAPAAIQIYFSYSGKADISTPADSSVKELTWTVK